MQGSSHRQDHEAPSILRYLKDAKNKLVGHPNAKINFYREGCIPMYVRTEMTEIMLSASVVLLAISIKIQWVGIVLMCDRKQPMS